MPSQTVQGALLRCSQGTAPSTMNVVSKGVNTTATAAATVTDFAPTANLSPFGMCNSKSNPQVQSLTAANQGVHTPAPCQPLVTGPWTPGSIRVRIRGVAALSDNSTCQCAWNGKIEVTAPGPPGTKVAVR